METIIVLVDTMFDNVLDRTFCEEIIGKSFASCKDFVTNVLDKGASLRSFSTCTLDEFVELANDQEINLDNYFMTYIFIPKSNN